MINEQAIALDSNYALAWYGLAACYSSMGSFAYMPLKEANLKSRQATLKALEIDESLPQAHAVKAIDRVNAFDWKGAEREFRQAIEIEPESSDVWLNYEYLYLVPMRRLDEAIASSRKAAELDPLSPFMQWRLGNRYYLTRQWDRAIEQFHNALELDPQYAAAHGYLGFTYLAIGKQEEGIRAVETAARLMGRSPLALSYLGSCYAGAGRIDEARRLLTEMRDLAQKIDVMPSSFAWIFFGLGETDQGFDWLERAFDEREVWIFTLNVDPVYDSLRSHPRFQALLRKMNLEA